MASALKWRRRTHGFSLIEVMVVLIVTSVMIAALLGFFFRQQRLLKGQRIIADMQSLGTIGFFVVGRHIRTAGSSDEGLPDFEPISVAQADKICVKQKSNGNFTHISFDHDSTANVLYKCSFLPTAPCLPCNPATADLAVGNVEEFKLTYRMESGATLSTPLETSSIRAVGLKLGLLNTKSTGTGKSIQRNFSAVFSVQNLKD